MRLAGAHNVLNATAALAMARELGVTDDALADGLRSFDGAGRRMELIADTAAVTIYDDYGHHPTEVRAAIDAVRQRVGARRLWTVFEPHMYSRTALLLDEFSTAFPMLMRSSSPTSSRAVTRRRRWPRPRRRHSPTRSSARPDTAIATGDRRRHDRLRRGAPGRRDAVLVMGPESRTASPAASRNAWRGSTIVTGARSAILGLLLAIAVTIAYRRIVSLVNASGARDQPATLLILLLAAFLGVLTAVATRMLRLPGATPPRCWCSAGRSSRSSLPPSPAPPPASSAALAR
jgi:hypothetical protein